MTPAEQELLRAVERRAEQVRRIAAVMLENGSFVPTIMGFVSTLLVRTLFALCGKAVREHFIAWIARAIQNENGICPLCDAELAEGDEPCLKCQAEMEEEQRQVDKFLDSENA